MKFWLIAIFLSLTAFSMLKTTADKKLLYKNTTYEEEIRTVILYPDQGHPGNVFETAVAKLGNVNLVLEFDDLVQEPERYRVRIIHCNRDWTKSKLSNIDFLYDYNEFDINSYEYSVDTKVAYIHYKFRLPQVKLPGNYLLVAYRGNDEQDILLSHRFMVYSNQVSINITSSLSGFSSSSRKQQQLDFNVSYKNYEIVNPLETIHIALRQNGRWDNAKTGLKPSFVRDHIQELEYRFFNFENSFMAGNEYRFFDMRSLRNPGQGVQNVDWSTYPILVNLMVDKPKTYEAYAQFDDINGNFYIQNTDTGLGQTRSDYTTTQFHLKATEGPVPGDVHIIGNMNNWEPSATNKMRYDKKSQTYNSELILKQGWYNYQYYVKNDTLSYNYLEGDHFETENSYEILVYHRPLTSRSDLLVGYGKYELNPRN